MEAPSITQLLKGFFDNSQWKYAAFWKLDHHFPMTLTLVNGCHKRNEDVESMFGDINFKSSDKVYSSCSESTDDPEDYSVQLLMMEMSHHKYSLGEGVVGKVALARDHCWVSCEDILTSNFNTDLISECPDEWLLQFAAGIKTIVLVPVLPLGVLQFGSFEAVAEDLEFIANIKEKLYFFHCMEGNSSLLNSGINYRDWSVSALVHNLMDSLAESSSGTNSILNCDVTTSSALNVNGSRMNPTMLSFIQDDCVLSGENLLESLKREDENEIGSSSIEMSNGPRYIGQVETKPNHINMEEEIWSHLFNSVGVLGEMPNELGSYCGKNMLQQKFGSTEIDPEGVENMNDFFTFPSESELHKAIGSVAYGDTSKSVSKYNSVMDTYSSSTLISNKRECDEDFEFSKEVDPEFLLDAIVGNLSSASDDTSCISNSVRSLKNLPTKFNGSIQPKIHSEESILMVENSDVMKDLVPAVMLKGKDEFYSHFTSSSFDGNSSSLDPNARLEKVNGPKHSSTNKKRTRVGSNNQKARPRDRQLIMDRMRELRELVPDGGRCSIDNLLERTIKRMLYLRKITCQAEKLKRFADCEVPKCKRQKINGNHPGRSCAFDFGKSAWPIVIEDLECSGHMLIEMVCNQHGLFLEIAQVIRRLELIILKGILENRSSTNWACFIVEAPRGFHRMDVLCPLLHLLQHVRNPVSYKS